MNKFFDRIIEYQKYLFGRQTIDIIGLDYYPGSWASGGHEKVVDLVKTFCDDRNEKVLVTECGFSDKDDSNLYDDKVDYYSGLTNDVKKYYHNDGGKYKGLLGVLWYNLFDNKDDSGRWWPWDVEYNFGVIETKNEEDVGGEGSYNRGESVKPVWKWLENNLTPK